MSVQTMNQRLKNKKNRNMTTNKNKKKNKLYVISFQSERKVKERSGHIVLSETHPSDQLRLRQIHMIHLAGQTGFRGSQIWSR